MVKAFQNVPFIFTAICVLLGKAPIMYLLVILGLEDVSVHFLGCECDSKFLLTEDTLTCSFDGTTTISNVSITTFLVIGRINNVVFATYAELGILVLVAAILLSVFCIAPLVVVSKNLRVLLSNSVSLNIL